MKHSFKRLGSCATALALVLTTMATLPSRTTSHAADTKPIFSAEAEDCTVLTGGTVTDKVYNDPYPGYSGEGFVWAGNAGGISFDITLPEGAMYEISTRCWMYLGDLGSTRMQSIAIDGEAKGSFNIPNKGEWMDFSFGYFYLEAGTHTIEIGASGSWGFILYDTVTFDYADMPDLQIDPTPVDPNATPETKALLSYMTEQYGKQIISGQQEIYGGGNDGDSELEFEYIYDTTGKYPALRGFDMMNYNPLYGWDDGTTGRIIQWVGQRGGIATASWHLNVPIDFDNYQLGDAVDWKECTYANCQKSNSTFNTANVLKAGTKERAYFEEAMRMLAEQLLILQENKIPIIFRPLHEAQGNDGRYGDGTSWFWWGDCGAEVYKELWKLLYTTLTETYGVHNCIWENNLYELDSSPEWYPGNDYVDMVAYDKYEGSPYKWGTDPATSVFLTLVGDTNDTKMVALSENDVIPDITKMVNEGAWWSYFCPWYGNFLMDEQYNTKAMLDKIYNSEYVVTMDELPSDLYGFARGNGGKWDVDGAYECEDGVIVKNQGTKVIDYKYCSGTGYVYLQGAEDSIEQTITVEKAGTYALRYGYQQNFETTGKTQNLYVNGKSVGTAFFPYAILFGESDAILVELQAGKNTIKLESVEGWTYLDYLVVEASDGETVKGDINADGKVSVSDVVLLQKYLLCDGSLTAQQAARADLTGDKKLNAFDFLLLKQILLQ